MTNDMTAVRESRYLETQSDIISLQAVVMTTTLSQTGKVHERESKSIRYVGFQINPMPQNYQLPCGIIYIVSTLRL